MSNLQVSDLLSALSNWLFNPSSECFISDIVIFSSRISVWSLFIIFVSLLTFSFCSYILLLISLSYFSIFSFSFLNIFKTVVFKVFFWTFSEMVSVNVFLFLWISHTFLFLCMHHNVFVTENNIFEYYNAIILEVKFCPIHRVCYLFIVAACSRLFFFGDFSKLFFAETVFFSCVIMSSILLLFVKLDFNRDLLECWGKT